MSDNEEELFGLTPPRMAISEFRDGGYLQEVNRRLLHPLGLALEVVQSPERVHRILLTDTGVAALIDLVETAARQDLISIPDEKDLLERIRSADSGTEWLSSIWDCRYSVEGISFGPGTISAEKAYRVEGELDAREDGRRAELGYQIQPID